MQKLLNKRQKYLFYKDKYEQKGRNYASEALLYRMRCRAFKRKCKEEKVRLDAIANGFCVWQTINLETGEEQWYCQYAIDGIVCGDTLREAIDKGIEANASQTN